MEIKKLEWPLTPITPHDLDDRLKAGGLRIMMIISSSARQIIPSLFRLARVFKV